MPDWKPAHYPSLSPYLICAQADAVIDLLVGAFGGRLLRRFDRPDGSLMHAEVALDDGVVMLGGANAQYPAAPCHLHVYVADAMAVYESALALGAVSVQAPARKEGDDLRGGFADAGGNIWWVATQ